MVELLYQGFIQGMGDGTIYLTYALHV